MDEKQFFYQLGKLIYRIDGLYEQYGRDCKIGSANMLWILYALNDDERHTQRQICDDWAIPRSTANTIIKDLQSKNIVTLSQIKGERRELLISLTPLGKEYADSVLQDLYNKEKEIFCELQNPDGVISSLSDLAQKMSIIARDRDQKSN